MGLGLNSMQGREAKHVRLSQFAKHSTKSSQMSMVLRHDFISNVWICKHELDRLVLYTKYKMHYIPDESDLETPCYCGFPLSKGMESCSICAPSIFESVHKLAVAGSLTSEICDILVEKV